MASLFDQAQLFPTGQLFDRCLPPQGGRLVRLKGDKALIGSFQPITITGSTTWSLTGNLTEKE